MKKTILISVLFSICFYGITFPHMVNNKKHIETGKYLYTRSGCGNCHYDHGKTCKLLPLQGIRKIRGKEWVYKFVQNPNKLISENKEAEKIYNAACKMPMTNFRLTFAEIDAICDYIDTVPIK